MSSDARPRPGSHRVRGCGESCPVPRRPAAARARGGKWTRAPKPAVAIGRLARAARAPVGGRHRAPRGDLSDGLRPRFPLPRKCREIVPPGSAASSVYCDARDEADLSAEEAQAGEDPRFPGADAHPGRSGDPQTSPPQGPEAPDSVAMPKRRRLSRSGEFDRVYRDGSSHATRYLVLYSFPRREGDEAAPTSASGFPPAARSAALRSGIG